MILAVTAMALVGCDADKDVSYGAIKGDLSPEVMTMTERPADVHMHVAQTNQQNVRMLWEDMGRTFYTDRPSFLSPLPVVPTSGMPR
ncbi:MAG: hypothetical protein ACYTGG_08705 [Planctomycetota bacterium]